MPLSAKARSRRILWIVYWLVIFTATHVPSEGVPRITRKNLDKVAHFAMYLGLTVVAARYLAVTSAPRLRARLLGWSFVFLAYGVFDEWLQQYTHRSMDFWDWVADACGIAVGIGCATVFLRPATPA